MNRPDPVPFDTHRFVKRLTNEGMPTGQAEVLADEQVALLDSNFATRRDLAFLATKEDVARCATKEDLAATNEVVARCATKEDLAATNEAVARCATKEDLAATNEALARCATNEELAATNEAVARCATKEDLAATNEVVARCATREDLAATNENLRVLDRRVSQVVQDVAVLKSDVHTLKWIVSGVGFGVLTLVLGVSSLLIRAFWTV